MGYGCRDSYVPPGTDITFLYNGREVYLRNNGYFDCETGDRLADLYEMPVENALAHNALDGGDATAATFEPEFTDHAWNELELDINDTPLVPDSQFNINDALGVPDSQFTPWNEQDQLPGAFEIPIATREQLCTDFSELRRSQRTAQRAGIVYYEQQDAEETASSVLDSAGSSNAVDSAGKKQKFNKNGAPRKLRQPRQSLIKWIDEDFVKALIGIVHACGDVGIQIPFAQAAQVVGPHCTASALQQAILKAHTRMNANGVQLPKIKMNWPRKAANKSNIVDRSDRLPRRKSTRDQGTQTRMLTLRPIRVMRAIMPTNYLPQGFTQADDPFPNASTPAAITVEGDWPLIHHSDTETGIRGWEHIDAHELNNTVGGLQFDQSSNGPHDNSRSVVDTGNPTANERAPNNPGNPTPFQMPDTSAMQAFARLDPVRGPSDIVAWMNDLTGPQFGEHPNAMGFNPLFTESVIGYANPNIPGANMESAFSDSTETTSSDNSSHAYPRPTTPEGREAPAISMDPRDSYRYQERRERRAAALRAQEEDETNRLKGVARQLFK